MAVGIGSLGISTALNNGATSPAELTGRFRSGHRGRPGGFQTCYLMPRDPSPH